MLCVLLQVLPVGLSRIECEYFSDGKASASAANPYVFKVEFSLQQANNNFYYSHNEGNANGRRLADDPTVGKTLIARTLLACPYLYRRAVSGELSCCTACDCSVHHVPARLNVNADEHASRLFFHAQHTDSRAVIDPGNAMPLYTFTTCLWFRTVDDYGSLITYTAPTKGIQFGVRIDSSARTP